ncbi:MAG: DNA methyltransferase [Parvularculaceae bacterium]
MTPADFIRKWERSTLKESSAAQEHFLDLCALLGEQTPAQADPEGENFCFEKGATKSTGGQGFADVWKRDHFAWEYKGPDKNLETAHSQLLRYAGALENPPLLIVSDTKTIIIRTNWTSQVQIKHEIALADLQDAAKRDLLKWAFADPERLKPKKSRAELTAEAAEQFSELAQRLRGRGHDPQKVAHFVNRLVFCMFAEDVGLLPGKLFEKALKVSETAPEKAQGHLSRLFAAMKDGGEFGLEEVPWFIGGLFDDDAALALDDGDIRLALKAARLYWGDIDPSILGTLFERGLDPSKRSQLGAHYTDRDKIMMIVGPVIVEPLRAEWEAARGEIETHAQTAQDAEARIAAVQAEGARLLKEGDSLAKRGEADRQKSVAQQKARQTKALNAAQKLYENFLERLRAFRVLDPACGSGNFLYLSLLALKDIERDAGLDVEAMGLKRQPPRVGPEAVKGIEINPYAAELARVSIWIGEIQWMRRNGFDPGRAPILRPLDHIECRDALIERDPATGQWREAKWPDADVIVGNPPFLGAKLMYRMLGKEETTRLRQIFSDRLPGFTDLVCYWFEKARAKMHNGSVERVGLVATKAIAKNTNLPVMRRIAENLHFYNVWQNEPWVIDGAAVRVALICFSNTARQNVINGSAVEAINPNLTSGTDVSSAPTLTQNAGVSFLGIQKSGPFDVSGDVARDWMRGPNNPNGASNSSVLKPYVNGDDLTGRSRDIWIIDLPRGLSENDASLFEAPFEYLKVARYDPDSTSDLRLLSEARAQARDAHARSRWWEQYWPRPEMRGRIERLGRYLVTGETIEHRLFCWLRFPILPDKNLIVFARDDDTFFGILQSKIHESWTSLIGNRMGVGNQRRYNATYVYETFPFPEGLTPDIPAADYASDPRAQRIAEAAKRLNELRENWLNPADLVRREPEVVPGYPDRILPVDEAAEKILKKRTLTNLYNERPAWLDHAHAALDLAVAGAYGWEADLTSGALTEEEILKRLFELNQQRAAKEKAPR